MTGVLILTYHGTRPSSTEMGNVNGIIRDHVTTWMTCYMAWERSLGLLRRLTQKTRDNNYYSFFLGGGGRNFLSLDGIEG